MTNYIPDQNKFRLAGPPSWWLRKLWDFDASLVVVPSRQECVYRLAQRRKLNLPEHLVNDALFQQSDTQMLASYGLIPVTSILATANWSNPYLFVELANRAPHRQGGWEKVIREVEDAEHQEEVKKQEKVEDMKNILAKDGWRLYQQKQGLRSQMWSPQTRRTPSPLNLDRAPALIIKK